MKFPGQILSLVMLCSAPVAFAQGTAFTYQGRLNDGANQASGIYDLRFAIYDASSAGTQHGGTLTNTATAVSNGLFTVTLDFGNQFPGADRWLELAVRTNGGGAFSPLSPRQPVTATPYAVRALRATSVDAGTVNNPSFIGTTSTLPLILSVNNQVALRLEDNGDGSTDGDSLSDGAPNVIGGAGGNAAGPGVVGVTIAGGGASNFYGNPTATNFVAGDYSTIGGGLLQRVEIGAFAATIAGGYGNTIGTYAQQAAIGGGYFNSVSNFSYTAVIGGGYLNQIGANAAFAVIPGGELNSVGNNAANAFAAGRRAKANHAGAFVWADTTDADFSSTSNNQFLIRATGGVGIGINNPTEKLDVAGTVKATAFIGDGAGLTNIPASAVVFAGSNYIDPSSTNSIINGGAFNRIEANAHHSVIAGGLSNSINTNVSFAIVTGGHGALASLHGQTAHAAGSFVTKGDAQATEYILRGQTDGPATNLLFLDGVSKRLTIKPKQTLVFDITVAARSTGTQNAGYQLHAMAERTGSSIYLNGSTSNLVDVPPIFEDTPSWKVQLRPNSANSSVDVEVISTGNTVRWVAVIRATEIFIP